MTAPIAPDRHLHVAQFIDSMDPGGAEEIVVNLSAALDERGHRATVFHFGNPWISARLEERGIAEVVLDDRHYRSWKTLLPFLFRFRGILKTNGVDVLHAHLLGAIFAGSAAARLAGIPAIGTIHDVYSVAESPRRAKLLAVARRLRCTLVAVSDDMLREVSARCGIPESGLTLLYNGIDVARFDRSARRDGPGDVGLITVCRMVRLKRLDVMLEAIARLRAATAFTMTFVGDGPLFEEYRSLAGGLGIGGVCDFTGFRDDIPRRLVASDVYVQASDSEGLSVSLLESMAAGLPAVVTDVGGNRELVRDGESGFLIERGNVQQLAEKLGLLIDDAELRARMGAEAARRASTMFSVTAMIDDYCRLYDTAARRDV